MSTHLVTTPTGNTGRHVLATVRDAPAEGGRVRVLVRDPARLDGPSPDDVVVGDLRDPGALRPALEGVEAAFFCVPQAEDPEDVVDYFNSFAHPFAAIAAQSGLRRLVAVSGGDDGDDSSGPGRALRSNEDVLAGCAAAARWVRCGYFMENLLWQAPLLAHTGVFTLPLAPDVPLALVAAADIGRACGRLVLDDQWSGIAAVQAYGPNKITLADAALVLSETAGRAIRYVPTAPDEWVQQLVGYGLSPAMANALREMFAAIEDGRDMGATASDPVECPTTLEHWAATTLAPALNQITPR